MHAHAHAHTDTFIHTVQARTYIHIAHKPQYLALIYIHITQESQNVAKATEKILYLHRFYNEISQLSLCKLTVTVSKSVQPLLMNWADNSRKNKAWPSLALPHLDRNKGRRQKQIFSNLISFLKNLPMHVCGTPRLWPHVMCDEYCPLLVSPFTNQLLTLLWANLIRMSLFRSHSSPGKHRHVELLVKWL